jgi:hypothetical protein
LLPLTNLSKSVSLACYVADKWAFTAFVTLQKSSLPTREPSGSVRRLMGRSDRLARIIL